MAKKPAAKSKSGEVPIGEVSHYYDKIGVAIVDAKKGVKKGDTLHFKGGKTDFTQTADSIQVDHKDVGEIKKGDSAGVKVGKEVREGDQVFIAKA
jgi:hypothetical protein